MTDIVRSQITEMIAMQAVTMYSTEKYLTWDELNVMPTFGEIWFWEKFDEMVEQAQMNLLGACEGWVTVEYEEEIADIIER